jgi:hypothetical protein
MSACQMPTVVTVPYASTLLCCFQLSVARCTQRSVCDDVCHSHHNIRSPPPPKQHQTSYQYHQEVLDEVSSHLKIYELHHIAKAGVVASGLSP